MGDFEPGSWTSWANRFISEDREMERMRKLAERRTGFDNKAKMATSRQQGRANANQVRRHRRGLA